MPLPRPTGRLSVEALAGAAPGAERPFLRGITFDLPPGESLGIIGPSAAGKSMLARMLVGVWPSLAGHVRLDGADLSQWGSEQVGPFVGYLPQDIELLNGSVSDNIARFRDPDPALVVAAAQKAGVHDMVLRLPKGYDTVIGEGGCQLSGGQRQRVGLARALYADPVLVVLDEPNSNLDGEGDQALAAALAEMKESGQTLVIISHRPAALARVDRILVLKEGQIEAIGPRDEILGRILRPVSNPQMSTVRVKPSAVWSASAES